ncbi:serine/threonine-protein kinase [Mastigocladopsis repens]|uniref:serine/threonine-protein kinase n=1 Tax=Mastigocladopsis repens TaxID=221287 RepID=UPI0002DF6BE6|nr:serine/threonine-protein kinase [Mastigocladopsis repens]
MKTEKQREKRLGGRYKLIKELARGGFGITYLAEDTLSSYSLCVIKKLDPQNADIETAKKLFQREANTLFHLQQNQQIPKYFNYFEEVENYYLVQEYIEGQTLYHLLDKRWTRQTVLLFLREILTILKYLHKINIIHRDIKPSNVMIRQEDKKFVLIDFGAVKQLDSRYSSSQQHLHTQTMIGTPGYAPQEQLAGKPHYNSDIYALGMTAIQLLTGKHPRDLRRDEKDKIIWSEGVDIDDLLASILTKMVYSNSEHRYQSVDDIFKDIDEITVNDDFVTNWNELTAASEICVPQFYPVTKRSDESQMLLKLRSVSIVLGTVGSLIVSTELINPFFRPLYHLYQGNYLLNLREPEKALEEFQNLIAITPNSAEAWEGRGDALLSLGRLSGALESYNKALSLKTDDVRTLNNKGKVFYRLYRYKEALETHEKVLKVDFNNADAWSGKGLAYLGLRQYKEASESFDKLKQIRPDIPSIWYEIGLATEQLQGSQAARVYFEEALGVYNDFLKRNPKDVIAWTDRGNVLQKLNRPQNALDSYQKALEIDKNFYEALVGKGNTLNVIGNAQEALLAFNQASEIRPYDYQVWYNRGILLGQHFQKHKEALQSFDKAIERRNDFYPAWLNKGLALLELKRYNESLTALDKAKEFEPTDPYVWANRGSALDNLGKTTEARDSYNKAIELGFPPEQLREQLEKN